MSRYVRRIMARSAGTPLRALHHPSEHRAAAPVTDPFVEAENAPAAPTEAAGPAETSRPVESPAAGTDANALPAASPNPIARTPEARPPGNPDGDTAPMSRRIADDPPRTIRAAQADTRERKSQRDAPANLLSREPDKTAASARSPGNSTPSAPDKTETAPPAPTVPPPAPVLRIEKAADDIRIVRRIEPERHPPRAAEIRQPAPTRIEPPVIPPSAPQPQSEPQITIGRVSVIVEAPRSQAQPQAPRPRRARASRPAEDGPAPSGPVGLGQI